MIDTKNVALLLWEHWLYESQKNIVKNAINNTDEKAAKKLCKILDIKPLIFMGFESIYNDETYENYNKLKKYDKEEIEQLKNMIALIEKDE